MWLVFLALCPSVSWAQQATANRAGILRRDPSKSSPVVAHLAKGDRLMLVQLTADSGFYHVKTEHDQIGWVWSKFVDLSPAPPQPPAPTPNPAPMAPDTGCDVGLWNHVYHSYRLIVSYRIISFRIVHNNTAYVYVHAHAHMHYNIIVKNKNKS